jgi:hypothetical protein
LRGYVYFPPIKNKYKELNSKTLKRKEKKMESYINCTLKTVTLFFFFFLKKNNY